MKKKRFLALLLVPLLVAGFGVYAYLAHPSDFSAWLDRSLGFFGAAKTVPATVLTERADPVRVAPPVRGRLRERFVFPGYLEPDRSVTIVSRSAGEVLELLVDEGDRVSAGQVVARVEANVSRLQSEQALAAYEGAKAQLDRVMMAIRPQELANAKAALVQAERELVQATNEVERARSLRIAGSLSASKLESAETALKAAETAVENARRNVELLSEGARPEEIAMARSNMRAAEKQLELARLQQGYAVVRATVGGLVAKTHTERGRMLGVGSPVATVMSEKSFFCSVMVPEPFFGRFQEMREGFAVKVEALAYPGRSFDARVRSVSTIINAETRSFDVDLSVSDDKGVLRPGMYIRAEFETETGPEGFLLPFRSALVRDGRDVVYVLEITESGATRARVQPIELGGRGASGVLVLGGLSGGESVIVEGNSFLEDGQNVRVVIEVDEALSTDAVRP